MKNSSSFWQDGGESSRGKISKAACNKPREGLKIVWGLSIGCKKSLEPQLKSLSPAACSMEIFRKQNVQMLFAN